MTTHTYDQEKAKQVHKAATEFLQDAKSLYEDSKPQCPTMIHLDYGDLDTIERNLKSHVPEFDVWLFGVRAHGRALKLLLGYCPGGDKNRPIKRPGMPICKRRSSSWIFPSR